jgi:hypothetical protein
METKIIKLHCGNGHTRGKAKRYHYLICSVFAQRLTKKGKLIWYNTGKHIGPMRGKKKILKEAKAYAIKENMQFSNSYGSLHNSEVKNIINYSI